MKRQVVDHLGRKVEYSFPPQRIVSLCPAITETLYALGLEKQIVGRTRYCIHPAEKVQQAVPVGGTKQVKWEKVAPLQPDLVIAEKEENTKEIVEMLEKYVPVYVAEIQSIEQARRMIVDIGCLTGRANEAEQLDEGIRSSFSTLPNFQGKEAAYLIWKKPYMAVGRDTYIHDVLSALGFSNPFSHFEGRYPEVSLEDLQKANLDVLLLATEPYPFKEEHAEAFKQLLPYTKVLIADGEMFWYGPKMLEAAEYFKHWPSLLNK